MERVRQGTLFARIGQRRIKVGARFPGSATATSDSDPDMRRIALRVLTERLSGGRRPLVEAIGPATGEGDLDAAPGALLSTGMILQAPGMKLILGGQCLRPLLTPLVAKNPTGGSAKRDHLLLDRIINSSLGPLENNCPAN